MHKLIFKDKLGNKEIIEIKYLSLLFDQIMVNLPKIKEKDLKVIIKISKQNVFHNYES
jgi:hypothetical protein